MGTRYNRLGKAVITSTHNLYFEQKNEISEFSYEDFQCLVVKFSIYLNRRVFVMGMVMRFSNLKETDTLSRETNLSKFFVPVWKGLL